LFVRAAAVLRQKASAMNSLPTPSASLVNRLTVTSLVAVIASAGVLGTVATLLARQSLET